MSKPMSKNLLISALLASAALYSANAAAGDEVGDIKQLTATCAACHGEGGLKPILPSYPIIGGQYETYLLHSLKGYRSGERSNAIMAGQAAGLNDAQIKALAHYYANQDGPLYTPRIEHGSN